MSSVAYNTERRDQERPMGVNLMHEGHMGKVVPDDKPARSSLVNSGDTRRWPRYPFVAIVLAADSSSEIGLTARTTDLSLGGCYINSVDSLPPGTLITIELVHKGESFHAKGRIVYSRHNKGMGISFIEINRENQDILARWIEELQTAQSPA